MYRKSSDSELWKDVKLTCVFNCMLLVSVSIFSNHDLNEQDGPDEQHVKDTHSLHLNKAIKLETANTLVTCMILILGALVL